MNARAGRIARFVRDHPIFLIWFFWSLALLAVSISSIARFQTQDPDDFMRLLEVRDLLAGQNWFDVTQYRMNPPFGAMMHWSRFVDVPIALALLVGRLFLAEPAASKFAMTVVPLAQLLLVMALVSRLMRALGADRRERLIAVAIVPLFPVLITCFLPMRIDHHGWQGIAALASALFLVRAPRRGAAIAGGAIAAIWLSISLEGLPLVVALSGLYALRFIMLRDRSVAWFLTALTGASILCFAATRPMSEFLPHCDTIGWPHLAAFSLAAALAWPVVLRPSGTDGGAMLIRAALLGAIGALAGAIIVAAIGRCAINPFADIDPVMERYWHGVIPEGLPIYRQLPSVIATLLWGPLVVAAAAAIGFPDKDLPWAERRWPWLAAYALISSLVAMLVMREAVNAQMLTVAFAGLLIARLMPRARAVRSMLPRILATCALPLLATPVLASAVGKSFDPATKQMRPVASGFEVGMSGFDPSCDLRRLGALSPSLMFATLDTGPEILAKTSNSVIASGYHRNMAEMRAVVEAFSGDPVRARAIVMASRARFVVICEHKGDTAVFASRRPDNLINSLLKGDAPNWLAPVPGFRSGGLLVWRVVASQHHSILPNRPKRP